MELKFLHCLHLDSTNLHTKVIMLTRYSRKKMVDIWSSDSKYQIWLDIEVTACEAFEKLKIAPKGTARKIKRKAKFSSKKILEIEKKVKHDVIAFLTNVGQFIGYESRFLHHGMTSSDVLDTCFNIQLKRAGELLVKDIEELLKSIKKRAYENKSIICMGRSHGMHAEPTTFGLKLASFYEEFARNLKRLNYAIDEVSTCAVSGPVGNFAMIDPSVEKHVAKSLGLKAESISTQIIPRDRHAFYFSILGIIASSVERFAIEIRHLQRTEVSEAEEFFSLGQKGSSAMPHKKNPILSENLTGLARIIRSYTIPSMENVALWHERDISHSSVERFIGPDATITLDFALVRLNEIIKNLVVFPKQMKLNIEESKNLFFSQSLLLALTEKGLAREKAYKLVQACALTCLQRNLNFLDVVRKDKEINKQFSSSEIRRIFDTKKFTKETNFIFKRVFKNKNR